MSKYWSDLVRDLEPYVPGEQPKVTGLIKLNTNENPYPPSPAVQQVLSQEVIDDLRLYPDPNSTMLKQALAANCGVTADHVFVGNGSDEVLALAFMTFFSNDKPLLFPAVTYSFYPVYCNLFNIDSAELPLEDDFSINFQHYARDNGGIIFPNPNAPTGILKPLAEIEALLQSNTESVVIVDEAYIDFGGESAVSLVERYANVLVIQTFSKSRSLAGMRVGFAIGQPELIDGLERVKNSFNSYPIDRLAERMAVAAIEDVEYFQRCTRQVMATRQWTVEQLSALNFDILPSAANFVFVKPTTMAAADVFAALREKKILVRYFNKPVLEQYLRISIGTDQEMQALVVALSDILSQ